MMINQCWRRWTKRLRTFFQGAPTTARSPSSSERSKVARLRRALRENATAVCTARAPEKTHKEALRQSPVTRLFKTAEGARTVTRAGRDVLRSRFYFEKPRPQHDGRDSTTPLPSFTACRNRSPTYAKQGKDEGESATKTHGWRASGSQTWDPWCGKTTDHPATSGNASPVPSPATALITVRCETTFLNKLSSNTHDRRKNMHGFWGIYR